MSKLDRLKTLIPENLRNIDLSSIPSFAAKVTLAMACVLNTADNNMLAQCPVDAGAEGDANKAVAKVVKDDSEKVDEVPKRKERPERQEKEEGEERGSVENVIVHGEAENGVQIEVEVVLQEEHKLEASIQAIRSFITLAQEGVDALEQSVKENDRWEKAREAKYGTMARPKLFVRPDLKLQDLNVKPFPFLNVEKDFDHFRLIYKFARACAPLEVYFNELANSGASREELTTLLPHMAGLCNNPEVPKYEYHDDGTASPLQDPIAMFSHVNSIAYKEFSSLLDDVGHKDHQERNRLLNVLFAERPELFCAGANRETMLGLADDVLRKTLEGYPHAFPEVSVFYQQKDQEIKGMFQPRGDLLAISSDAFWLRQQWFLFHETSHASSYSLIEYFLREHQQERLSLKAQKDFVKHANVALQQLKKMQHESKSKDGKKNIDEVQVILKKIILEYVQLQKSIALHDSSGDLLAVTQLDELNAALGVRLFIRIKFENEPEIAARLLQVYQYEMRSTPEDLEHTGSYLYSEEYLQRNGGTLVEAVSGLQKLKDPVVIERHLQRIRFWNGMRSLNDSAPEEQRVMRSVLIFFRNYSAMQLRQQIEIATLATQQQDDDPDKRRQYLEKMVRDLEKDAARLFLEWLKACDPNLPKEDSHVPAPKEKPVAAQSVIAL